jgi:hypothetical protein
MKDWVRPFLSIEEQESVDDDAIYSELAGSFNLNFGRGIYGGAPELMRTLFGFVLANLPEEVFTKLSEMKNLFFSYIPDVGAEVKVFPLSDDLNAGEKLFIVTLPYIMASEPSMAVIGEIAHELAHVYAGHIRGNDEIEEETDEIAKGWGFEEAISAFRIHEMQQKLLQKKNKLSTSSLAPE